MRLAIYVHVSERDGAQIAEEQLLQMKAMGARDGWELYRVFYDTVPFGEEERPEYQQMLSDAEEHLFDALLFWTLESLCPQNTSQTLALLHKLSEWGVCFCSYKEQHLNSCHLLRDAVISLIATFTRQDGVYIGHRTKAGLIRQQKAQKAGPAGRLGPGRPTKEFDREKARTLHAADVSYEKIAKACGVSKATIARFFKSGKT